MGGNCLVYMCYCYWFFDLIVHEVYMISRTYITGASYLFVCSFITNFQYTDIIHLEEGLSARGFDVIRLNTYNTVIFLIFLSTTWSLVLWSLLRIGHEFYLSIHKYTCLSNFSFYILISAFKFDNRLMYQE